MIIEEFQKALLNWISESTSLEGKLPDDIVPSEWVARQVVAWWKEKVQDDMANVQGVAYAIREELERLGGWKKKELGDAMHELAHLDDYLADLCHNLGIIEDTKRDNSQQGASPD